MNRIVEALRVLTSDLDALGQPWALVGGLAVSARAEPRTTRDVDVCVAVPDDTGAEGVVNHLRGLGYQLTSVIEQTAMKRMATVRLLARDQGPRGVVVDVLFASSGIEAEVAGRAERLEIVEGLTAPVAALSDLLALKVLSRNDRRRPRDAGDLESLLALASEGDIQNAGTALDAVTSRGFHRQKDLRAELTRAIGEFCGPRR